mmetsp:Transcript_113655/g.361046  ORF Transcript_113655/g.361046 Transcript_113655/m.361046 type:complete len:790 (-) Transcript_113655:100-2469(-)
MYRWLNDRRGPQRSNTAEADTEQYDEFAGRIIVVDLAELDGKTEDFDGRAWLEGKVNAKEPVGWDLEWQPDRYKDSDNPIALMQFADDKVALLLRTHKTTNWLPLVVMKALCSESCRKVGVGWDGPDKQKMDRTFHFLPFGIEDLAEIAKKKGVPEQGLKSLTLRFGYKIRKDSRVARSNWAAPELTQEQIRYAAEDAHYSYVLYDKLRELPDQLISQTEGFDTVNEGLLTLQPGWEEQGITRRHDGLYCTTCTKGPMTVPMVVERHLESHKHRKKIEERMGISGGDGAPLELPEEWVMEGIIGADGVNDLKPGEFTCQHCGAKLASNNIEAHLKSKKHLKHTSLQEEKPEATAADIEQQKRDKLLEYLWNLPDYVTVEDPCTLHCGLCPAKADVVTQMFMHLGGNAHNKKCKQLKYPEVLFIKDRDRLEDFLTGKPIVREGHKVPRKSKKTEGDASGSSAKSSTPGAGKLPAGWKAYVDPASQQTFYHNETTQEAMWDHPDPLVAHAAELADAGGVSAISSVDQRASSAAAAAVATAASAAAAAGVVPHVTASLAQAVVNDNGYPSNEQGAYGTAVSSIAPALEATASDERGAAVAANGVHVALAAQGDVAAGATVAAALTSSDIAESRQAGGEANIDQLPPGWQAAFDPQRQAYYYADMETQVSSWDPPPPYAHGNWTRNFDPHSQAYWEGPQGICFYEKDSEKHEEWERILDQQNRTYWSCRSKGIRFFEKWPPLGYVVGLLLPMFPLGSHCARCPRGVLDVFVVVSACDAKGSGATASTLVSRNQ